jgi:hypothetical protein
MAALPPKTLSRLLFQCARKEFFALEREESGGRTALQGREKIV